jgi:3-oxoacyl-[acyl-carrier protein] reductase
MDLKLKDKTVLITGSSRGIGLAAATTFAAEGARVAINGRGIDDLTAAARTIKEATGADVLPVAVDVSDLANLPGLVETVTEKLGPVDVLVNNAGAGLYKAFLEVSEDELISNYHLNMFSTYRLCQLIVPHMIENGGGSIVNVGGISGKQAPKWPLFSTASGPTKAAMFNFTKALATEFGRKHIRVNYVMPGLTLTPRFDQKLREAAGGDPEKYEAEMQRWGKDILLAGRRWATPEEIGDVIAFVASDRARYMTAASVIVDGGIVRAL